MGLHFSLSPPHKKRPVALKDSMVKSFGSFSVSGGPILFKFYLSTL